MHRWGIIAAAVVVAVLTASQVLLPPLASHEVESRLTANGGEADVTLGALPALRLLLSDGERFEVRARDLDLELEEEEQIFGRLDGFSIVDVSITNLQAGPFALGSFDLDRRGGGPYSLIATGTTTTNELAQFGFEQLELPGESLIDSLLDPFLDQVDATVPLELDMELISDEGRVRVLSGGGTVAGVPTGPLAELITSAIVVRL